MKRFLLFVLLLPSLFFGQAYKTVNNVNPYKLMFGLGWSVWDNDGNPSDIAAFNNMHAEVYPSRLFADYYFYKGWSAELALGFVRYKGIRPVNDQLNVKGFGFSTDANLKYSFYGLLGKGLLDPYIIMGAGGTIHQCNDTLVPGFFPTINLGAGINFWFNNAIGLQLQTAGKIGLTSDFFGKADYLQHSLGLVLRLESTKRGSEGEFKKEKLKLDTKKKRIKTPKRKGDKNKGSGKGDDA
ncbi:MAG: hypothetical protein EB023_03770 [Flavobacteriia bacterium]|nr:hypothetical protein [Flavobacteriia bacterium]